MVLLVLGLVLLVLGLVLVRMVLLVLGLVLAACCGAESRRRNVLLIVGK